MKEENYTYETKCRRCGHITEWYGMARDQHQHQPDDYKRYMYEKMNSPSLYECKKCEKQTVQDVCVIF